MNGKKAKALRKSARTNYGPVIETNYTLGEPCQYVDLNFSKPTLLPNFVKSKKGKPRVLNPVCTRGIYQALKAQV